MKVIFFGTPEFVIPIAQNLQKISHSNLVAVVTQEPKPIGRRQIVTPSPIEAWAKKRQIPVLYNLIDLPPADLGVVASYGQIIPPKTIDRFRHGILNIHFSLLPKFRGASPVQATILTQKDCGVSIIKMDAKLDHGPIISQFTETVKKGGNTQALRQRLAQSSAQVLITIIPSFIKGVIKPREQNHSLASLTRQITKQDGFIPPNFIQNALEAKKTSQKWQIGFIKDFSVTPNAAWIERFIRAMSPWPMAWTLLHLGSSQQARRLIIHKAHQEEKKLVLDMVQLEGKKQSSWKQFKQGYPEITWVSDS
jgi:methionyl-tRNA formyltransferase